RRVAARVGGALCGVYRGALPRSARRRGRLRVAGAGGSAFPRPVGAAGGLGTLPVLRPLCGGLGSARCPATRRAARGAGARAGAHLSVWAGGPASVFRRASCPRAKNIYSLNLRLYENATDCQGRYSNLLNGACTRYIRPTRPTRRHPTRAAPRQCTARLGWVVECGPNLAGAGAAAPRPAPRHGCIGLAEAAQVFAFHCGVRVDAGVAAGEPTGRGPERG
nr:hypothetical protein [Tanacetum cinerariifolium]